MRGLGTRAKQGRFNPLPGLTAERLSRVLDQFNAGHLREAVTVWEHMEERDDLLRGVILKRKKAVARHGWTVLVKEGLGAADRQEAARHAAALDFFYSNLECEHAVDTNERGGFKLLARQMMDAVGKRFAVHEVVWRRAVLPNRRMENGVALGQAEHSGQAACGSAGRAGLEGSGDSGELHAAAFANQRAEAELGLTATFRFVPLNFFENTTGELRFLREEWGLSGEKLEAGAWMVTAGEGLMAASSVAWLFKHMSLNEWLSFCEQQGTPGVRGVTAAARDSADWKALERTLGDLLEGKAVVTPSTDDIRVVDLSAGNHAPFPQLVERMDRMMASLWRGADLSTLSRDRGYGASLQEKETCALEEDDAEMLTETLRRYVDEWVIRHTFGEGVRPLAGVKVLVSPKECTMDDLRVDEFLLAHGAPLDLEGTMARYGRTPARAGGLVMHRAAAGSERNSQATHAAASGREQHANVCTGRSSLETEAALFAPGVGHNVSYQAAVPLTAPPCGMENAFNVLQTDWVQLSPYGDFPHARGLQRVDQATAAAMVRHFESFAARLGRLFGGAPFYVGHPDMVAGEGIDRKAYGWVEALEARENGLFGRVKWSDAGLELLRQGHFKFLSPYWEAREIGRERGERVYQPVALISVGLTNQPNIPVQPLANESGRAAESGDEARGDTSGVSANSTDDNLNITPLLREITVETALENAAREGRITPAQQGDWRARLRADFPGTLAALRDLRPAVHVESVTLGLGRRKGEMARVIQQRERIQAYVREKTREGLSYDEAWEQVKRERGGLFGAAGTRD